MPNHVTITGNLTADPDLRYTQSGTPVIGFTIADTPRRYDKDTNEWVDGDPLFLRCSLWREYAEHAAESLTKGTHVYATGKLKQRDFEDKEGIQRTVTELDVTDFGPTLKWATAKVTKASSNGNGSFAHHPADSFTPTEGAGQEQEPPF